MPTARGKGGFISKGIDPVQAPDAPTIGSVSGGSGSASVDATAPTDVGGAAIDQYVARSTDGTAVATSVTPPLAFSGLTNGQSYQFEVLAENVFGPSQYSAASASVTPEAVSVEDVFSTYLYDGNGSTQTITNGIDLDGEGGLVWIKNRTFASNHILTDSERGINSQLRTNETGGVESNATIFDSFNSDGFSLDLGNSNTNATGSGEKYASWTFRKAPKFFDVVTWTGTNGGGDKTISHSLGAKPAVIIVRRYNGTDNWSVYHKDLFGGEIDGSGTGMYLNSTSAAFSMNNEVKTVTDSDFTVGSTHNGSSSYEYVAYLFAHNDDDGEFGEDADQDIIKCGTIDLNSGSDTEVDLGFEPQWLMYKPSSTEGNWFMLDNMRGGTADSTDNYLMANSSSAEANANVGIKFTSTGFIKTNEGVNIDYIYIAIRRGPMKTPESGTEVFNVQTSTGSGWPGSPTELVTNIGFPADLSFGGRRTSWIPLWASRLQGNEKYLISDRTSAEGSSNQGYIAEWDHQDSLFVGDLGGLNDSGASNIHWNFRRAPGFFDVVAYEGNGVAGRALSHNLGVEPELIIFKSRSNTYDWQVYHKDVGIDFRLNLNSSNNRGSGYSTLIFNNTLPTSSVITLGTWGVINGSGVDNIVYLFATLPGVSKVGSYTGNGTSQTIDCGFSAGARFVLIKSAVSSQQGDWHVFDAERGIVSGNDPRIELNTTDAEDTGTDYIDPASSGFAVTSNSNVNTSGDTYIFLAIA